ncbi:MAG: DUF3810 domain-containing protein [Epulopiscium sp.]|nr:DUF3810 domain-containing protein [Candidatus Epulonipiscium sp.]
MRLRKWCVTNIIILIAFITWILTLFAKGNPSKVEKIYSSTIYPYVGKTVGKISGIVPFSLGEVMIYIVVLIVLGFILTIIVKPRLIIVNIKEVLHIIIRAICLAYTLFYFLWGFNYYRQDYMVLAGIDSADPTIEDLEYFTLKTIESANRIRVDLDEDENGIFKLDKNFKNLGLSANQSFSGVYIGDVGLDGKYGRAKPLMISKWMSYTGITGIYFPYTMEANINTDVADVTIPATICHEIAHQRGFAKEEEANFISYLISVNHEDPNFQYSGHYLALQYLLSDIKKQDIDLYYDIREKISEEINRDMENNYLYWKEKEGKVEEVATTLNDNYLKANNQKSGVESYNGVVELLLTTYKTQGYPLYLKTN